MDFPREEEPQPVDVPDPVEGPQPVDVPDPVEGPQPVQVPDPVPVPQPVQPAPRPRRRRGRYRARWYFNRNHLIKSRNGARRRAGYRRVRRRWRLTWRRNPGHVALQRPVRVDAALAAIIGVNIASRAHISRLLWNYIKANHLQNPQNGRLFVPDARLATVVGVEGEEMNGFTMMKFVKNHILRDGEQQPARQP